MMLHSLRAAPMFRVLRTRFATSYAKLPNRSSLHRLFRCAPVLWLPTRSPRDEPMFLVLRTPFATSAWGGQICICNIVDAKLLDRFRFTVSKLLSRLSCCPALTRLRVSLHLGSFLKSLLRLFRNGEIDCRSRALLSHSKLICA
jgi:hypothetical protein